MRDPRLEIFAKNIIRYSTELQPGENILIELIGLKDNELAKCFIEEVQAVGAFPFLEFRDAAVTRKLIMNGTEEQFKRMAEIELERMRKMDAYVGVRSGENVTETSDVPEEKMKMFMSLYQRPVTNERVNNTKWCIMRYPNGSMAQLANTSTDAFEDFYFNVCNLDYSKMEKAMDPLVELMERTNKVRIISPGTDLTFSIKGIPAIKCCGKRNIPDGEVYTAPVIDSVNGVISYNTPTVYSGSSFENVVLRFENGKIVEATSSNTPRLNEILDTDEGARFIGEFAIGVNPHIHHPMKDILFDEKIDGSLHFTPGQAYKIADNSNRSSVHWDMVLIQRPDYGCGEIYFDDVLIRKDGRFVIKELEGLNPENLV
ncbi:thermophilic metalloprotease, M29 family [Paenibacillus larvae subsp. larvae]|uniref:Thermophilic metalloprotease, M29 family n=1 Tax=Paenibacillus larvae subsp. larvae TaxID=147375 RepID=A0A2L1UDE6_9BACL|nr:aminopeptidase [Paenibacillus larvae]AQT86538.1 aminopeptidase [Paenibacillus larvae subsp. pulvifaciens]AQZ48202.1 aminopeptidase [Paenibacillus larvae subsp. pulvifaciens]AVF26172.1 thermophilic metalloprotease, M29 family [Paenibacillus larvae subsp. larvae]AVF30949.1 thermophilic metalloprotease, M29 family [Paenibacillus larvae subsp. larvae]MBH0343997.1 aminopeptidase [Paenibacillus larvae]